MTVYPKRRKRLIEKKNPMVFLDVSVDEVSIGPMVFKLFKDVARPYAENFRALCTGEKGIGEITSLPLHYKDSYFIDIEQGSSYVKGGDFLSWSGFCGESIYGMNFPNYVPKPRLGCNERGLLCMNIGDQYTLGSHFVITLEADQSLDGLHVVFGKLVKGFATLDQIARVKFGSRVQVSNCGEYDGDETEEVLTIARETTTKIFKFRVYLDVHFFGPKIERMVFELFHDIAPLTAENFRALCTEEKGHSPKTGKCLRYRNSFFHMKKGSSYVKGGSLSHRTDLIVDEGVESIYCPNSLVAERNRLKHDKEGLLSMSRRDIKAFCGSFIITLRADPRLDSSHVVFGKLVDGLDTLRDLGKHCFMTSMQIIDCGEPYDDQDEEFGEVNVDLW